MSRTNFGSSEGKNFGGIMDPIALNRLSEMVQNLVTSRTAYFEQFGDPRRDIEKECGYPKEPWNSENADKYYDMYMRDPIACRVCNCMPHACWKVTPKVFESQDADEQTDFEREFSLLGRKLRGVSYHKDVEDGNILWEYLKRADVMSGIGHFGVMLLGLSDGKNLDQPVAGALGDATFWGEDKTEGAFTNGNVNGTDAQYVGVSLGPDNIPARTKKDAGLNLNFIRVFPESLVQITRYEANIRSPRFGQPIMYRIQLNDPREQHSGIGLPLATVWVHWSRVIHLADNLTSSEVFGTPRMRPVLYRLLDLQKLYGGSAEMYWQGAFPGLSAETHPQLGGDVTIDQQAMKDAMENYFNSLQRYIGMAGVSMKTLSPTVVDPTPQIEAALQAICIQLDIPKRVFMGSERGELASSQDDAAWNDRVMGRQNNYLTPRVITPFLDRLISVGVLPEPSQSEDDEVTANKATGKIVELYRQPDGSFSQREVLTVNAAEGPGGGYSVEWPDLDATTDKDKAQIGLFRTQALAAYAAGGVEALVSPLDQFTKIMGIPSERAKSMVESAEDNSQSEDNLTPIPDPQASQEPPVDSSQMESEAEQGDEPASGAPGNEAPEGGDTTENFDPDQERDEKGQWAAGNHSESHDAGIMHEDKVAAKERFEMIHIPSKPTANSTLWQKLKRLAGS
jgi:hypothetical protein